MDRRNIHIGTSGWQYDHWKGPFYPKDLPKEDHLGFYTEKLDTVEINNSFYQLPEESTFQDWFKNSPNPFLFSVKANRYITHMKNLMDIEDPLDKFFSITRILDEKLGAVLFQLPPQWNLDLERFKKFSELIPTDIQVTVEFRNETWHTEEIYAILREKNIAFCIFELAGFQSPSKETADFVYIRLHGPDGAYQGDYQDNTLKKWADQIIDWESSGKEIYLYFDNDQKGYAPKNAQRLKELIKKSKGD